MWGIDEVKQKDTTLFLTEWVFCHAKKIRFGAMAKFSRLRGCGRVLHNALEAYLVYE
jgi:hypothetical protein